MIKYRIQDKLFNVYAGIYCLQMYTFEKKSPKSKRRYQEKKIRRLLYKAYELPIYREKFDKAGVKPSDFKNIDDLTHFPILTKEEYQAVRQVYLQ